MQNLPIVGVMGARNTDHVDWAAQVGALVATLGFSLLTGGGTGSMEAASRGFVEARPASSRGTCIGILPAVKKGDQIVPAQPNAFVEIAIRSPLGVYTAGMDDFTLTRNHTNILTSNAIVALPGAEGTANEVFLAQWYEKPLLLFGPQEATEALIALVEPKYAKGAKELRRPEATSDIEKVRAFLTQNLNTSRM